MAVASITLFLSANAAEIRKGLDAAKSSITKFQKATSTAMKEASSTIASSLNVMTGGLSGMAQGAFKAFSGMTSGLKGLAGAFASTGIGAIIIAITTAIAGLVAAFKRSGEAGDKLAEVMGFLQGMFDFLIGKLVDLGEWLVRAFQDPKTAVKELWEVIKENLVTRFQGVVQLISAGWEYIKNGAIGVGLAIEGIFSKEKREEAKKYFEEAALSAGKMGEALVMIATGKTSEELKAIGKEIIDAGKNGTALARQEDALMDQKIKDTVELQRMETQLANTRAELAEQDIRTTEGRQKRQELFAKALQEQEAISKRRIAYAKAEYDLIVAQAEAKNDTSDETRLKIAEAQKNYEAEITKSVEETLKFKKGEATTQSQLNAEIAKQLELEKKDRQALQDIITETAILQEKDAQKAAFMKLEADKQAALAGVEEASNAAEQKAAIEELYWQKGMDLSRQFFDENKKLAIEQAEEEDRIRQEQLEKDRAAQEQKIQRINDYGSAAIALADTIATFQEAAMNRELAAAGDNEEQKEKIRKKYAKRQKAISIMQAIIGTALAVVNALQTQPFLPMGPIMAAVAGAAGAAQIALIASQPLAKGGIAYGEALATVGEYPGARMNPEVIAPLDKLKKLIGSTNEMGEVRFVIEQNQLVGILNKAQYKNIYF